MATTQKKAAKAGPDLTDAHKAALAEGRLQSQRIRSYLDALQAQNGTGGRGRKRSPETITKRLEQIEKDLAEDGGNPLQQVQIVQEQMDLQAELEKLNRAQSANPDDFEDGFIEAVGPYSERKGISYNAWRKIGVPAATLRKAGISRASS